MFILNLHLKTLKQTQCIRKIIVCLTDLVAVGVFDCWKNGVMLKVAEKEGVVDGVGVTVKISG